MRVTHAPRHSTHVLAVNQDSNAERFNSFLDELGDGVSGAFLVLQAASEVSGDL
jgi:hypothetical protein